MFRLFRLWRLVASDLRLLWFALWHRSRPVWLWPVTVLLVLYTFDPLNFALPFAGIIDDFVLVPLLVHLVVRLLPTEIKTGFVAGSLLR